MGRYIVRRLLEAIVTAIAVSAVVYGLLFLASDPAVVLAGPEASRSDIELVRRHLGLDQPFFVQYGRWLGRVLQGDLGTSFRSHQPVLGTILERLPATLTLAGAAFAIATLVAVPLGTLAAMRPGSAVDHGATLLATTGQAVPLFWLGIMLAVLFGARLAWLPVTGMGSLRHLILPAVTLAMYPIPLALRLTRSSMQEVLSADYIRTAAAKGLGRATVVRKHALRGAMIPVVGLLAVQLGGLLGGSIVVEAVFAWPGIGTLAISSITGGDFPVIQGIVLLLALVFVLLNLTGDVVVGALDPRIRFE